MKLSSTMGMPVKFNARPSMRFGREVGPTASFPYKERRHGERMENGAIVGVVNYQRDDGQLAPLLTQVTPAQEALLQKIADNTTGLKEALDNLAQAMRGRMI